MQGNKRPNWNFSLLEEEYIYGVDSEYEGRFFRYKLILWYKRVLWGTLVQKELQTLRI